MKGSKALLKMLEDRGVENVFGYPGATVIPIYDEFLESDVRHILVRHEQCAAHMADGFARAAGTPGVCLATSGPGTTNLVTGIATAYADSVPMIALTGQVGTNFLGAEAFQEVDSYSLMMPVTKHNFRVLDPERLPHAINEGWKICQTGRPGPVHIDMPVDQINSDIDDDLLTKEWGIKEPVTDVSRINDAAKEIYDMAGEEFNIASPKQIGEILFNKLGLKGNRKGSTSVDHLKDIADEHPIVNKILEYRKYFKLVSTYVEGLKAHIYPDGKIHAKFNQALTTTGRLSSSDPNLQNISVRDEEGKLIRKAFYYKEGDVEILSLDYSQIELRVLSSLSDCKALQDIFKSGEDIHAATAKKVFNLQDEPTQLQRRKAKTVNFGIVYGISDWGLADELEISVKEAKEIITNFYNSFPEISTFFRQIVDDATKNGYVVTALGRRRYLREIHDSNYQVREFAKRAAMNAPIQGTAADLIKLAMISVAKALKEGGFKSKMVLQIHDELIFKVYKEEKDTIYRVVKDVMENAMSLAVPLEVDGGFGKSWYDAK